MGVTLRRLSTLVSGLGVIFASTTIGMGASLTPASAASDPAPIVVGGEGQVALTAGVAQGFEAGILRFNEAGGLGGRKIKFLGFLDDNFSASTALANVQKLVQEDHVFAVVPFNNEIATDSISTFLAQNKTPMIGYGVTPVFVNNPWAWSVVGDYAAGTTAQTTQFVQMTDALHAKASTLKWGLVGTDVPGGETVLKLAATSIHSIGEKVVYNEANIPAAGTTNYLPYAQAIVSSGANVIYNALSASDVIGLAAALKSAGYKGASLNGQTYIPGELASNPNEEAALQGAYVSSAFPVNEDKTPAVKQALKDLKAVGAPQALNNGTSVGYWSAQLFIAMLKSTAAKDGGASKVTPQSVEKFVNSGYTYKGNIAGGLAPETFPAAERNEQTTCYATTQIEGPNFVLKEPYACNGKLIPVG